jgi:hypothetical protein
LARIVRQSQSKDLRLFFNELLIHRTKTARIYPVSLIAFFPQHRVAALIVQRRTRTGYPDESSSLFFARAGFGGRNHGLGAAAAGSGAVDRIA